MRLKIPFVFDTTSLAILFLTVLFSFLFYLLGPILLPLIVAPFAIYRFTVVFLAKLFRRDLIKVLDPLASVLAAENVDSQDAFTIMVTLEVEAPTIDVTQIHKDVKQNALEFINPETGQRRYPEMSYCQASFLGYIFWTKSSKFKLEEHVNYLENLKGFEKYTGKIWDDEKEIGDLIADINRRGWRKGRPLWEIVVVPNVLLDTAMSKMPSAEFLSPKCYVIYRMHHSLGDGFCMLRILPRLFGFTGNILEGSPVSYNRGKQDSKKGIFKTLIFCLKVPFELAHLLAREIVLNHNFNSIELTKMMNRARKNEQKVTKDQNEGVQNMGLKCSEEVAHFPQNGVELREIVINREGGKLEKYSNNAETNNEISVGATGRRCHVAYSDRIPMALLKKLRDRYKVSISAVVQAIVTGGIREMFLKYEKSTVKIPRHFSMAMSVIMPGVEDKMTNNVALFSIPVPIREANAVVRLKEIEKELQKMRNSSIPIMSYLASTQMFGLLPIPIIKFLRLGANQSSAVCTANLVGPSMKLCLQGHPISGIRSTVNNSVDCQGYMMQFITYNGEGRIMAAGLNHNWATERHAYEMIDFCNTSLLQLIGKKNLPV